MKYPHFYKHQGHIPLRMVFCLCLILEGLISLFTVPFGYMCVIGSTKMLFKMVLKTISDSKKKRGEI